MHSSTRQFRNTMLRATRYIQSTRLEAMVQRFFTYVTGVPLEGQKLLWKKTAIQATIITYSLMALSLILGYILVSYQQYALLPIVWVTLIHTFQINFWDFYHFSKHRSYPFPRLAKLVATISLCKGHEDFEGKTHDDHHRWKSLLIDGEDETYTRLTKLFSLPFGAKMWVYWLMLGVFLTVGQLFLLVIRIIHNLRHVSVSCMVSWGIIFWLTYVSNSWEALALVVLCPILLWGIPMSINGIMEHQFPNDPALMSEDLKPWQRVELLTNDYIVGKAFPVGEGFWSCMIWWLTLPVFFLERFLIFQGSFIAHKWHHIYPSDRNWMNAPFAVESIYKKKNYAQFSYEPLNGTFAALRATFYSMSIRQRF